MPRETGDLVESISIHERFRPARVAMLMPKGDFACFEEAVRLNTALAGGMFNPIIAYSPDREDEAIQMLRFFDPDVLHPLVSESFSWLPEKLRPQSAFRTPPLYYSFHDATR